MRVMPRRTDLGTLALVAVLTFLGGLVLSALAGLLSPAHGAVKYLSTSGSATWAAASNPGTPCNLTTVNANIAGGDTVYAADGSYGEFKPDNNGTSSAWMTMLGNSADSTAVTFSNYQALSGTFPNGKGDWTRLRWVTLTNLDLGSKGVGAGGVHRGPYGIRITNSRIDDSSVNIMGSEILIEDCDVPSATTFGADNNNGPSLYYSNLITINRCRFSGSKSGTGDWQFLKTAHTRNFAFTNNSVAMTNSQSSGFGFIIEMYKTRYATVADNTLVYVNNAGGGAGTQMVYTTRDSTQDVDFLRNRVTVSGTKPVGLRNAHNGSFDYAPNHRWIGNIIKVANPPGEGAVRLERPTDNLDFSGNVIFSGGAQPALSAHSGVYTGVNNLFRHNTLAAANAQVVNIEGAGSWTASKWVSNLVYSTVANSASSGGATLRLPTSIESDSLGLVYTPLGTSGNAIYKGSLGAPGSGGGFGQSGKAVWGSPRFVDSTYAAFDAGISQTGYADDVKSPSLQDGFAGAFSDSIGGSTGTSDTSPPSTVSDLSATPNGPTTVELEWYSPDDDGTGTGAAAVYDIRYSTSTITDGNWSSALQFTGEPTPQDFDNQEVWTTPAVLSPSTLYYFALKSRDEVGNESALSNVASATTNAPPPSNAITLGTLETYPNFNTVGYRLYYSGDANLNSTAVAYLISGSWPSTDSLYRIHPPDTLRSESMFAGSAFWLSEGTTYTLAVVVTDADGGGATLTNTFTTRTATPTSPTGTSYYVAAWGAGSDSAAGTAGAPFRTMQKAWSVMTPGDAMRLMAGVHRDTLATVAADSGTVAAPKHIIGEAGAILSGADPAYLVRSDWDSLTAAGQKLYFQRNFPTWPRTVVFGDSMRLFRHKTANSLATDSLGTAGNLGSGWARSKAGDTLYVQLEGGASPNGYAANIASRTHALRIKSNNVVVDGLAVRFFGTDWRTDYYLNVGVGTGVVYINDAKNVTVRNCHFLNNGWDAVAADSSSLPVRDITVEGNIFRDTRVAGWGLYSSNTVTHHPVVFMGSGRGGVVRNNTYRGFKDGGFRVDQLQPAKFADADINYNDMRDWTLDSDAVELDACDCHNVRVWGNQAYAGGNFLDTEIRRGPVYAIYNRGARLAEGVQFRTFYVDSTFGPFHLLHNTLTSTSGGFSGFTGVNAKPVRGVTSINNLIVGPYRAYDDANGKWRAASWVSNFNVFSGGGNLARVDTVIYGFVDSTAYRTTTGWDKNSRFRASFTFADTANFNVSANSAMPSIDRGRLLRGINTAFASNRYKDSAPDMGAVEYDATPPPAISALAVVGRGVTRVTVAWVSPGDSPGLGSPAGYDLRYATSPINDGNWSSAAQVTGEPAPKVAGSPESYTITGLALLTTYYFAVKSTDDVGNISALSNVAQGATVRPSEEK